MRITLLGFLVVLGASLLVLYAVKVYQEQQPEPVETIKGPDNPGFPFASS